MERTKIDEAGRDGAADAPESHGDDVDARTVGDVIAAVVAGMGADTAMMWSGYADIGAAHEGRPLNSASVCGQRARPHLAQTGIRSK